MAKVRVSQLQKRMLRWLAADEQRSKGLITSSHQELVQALGSDKGNISHSLQMLESRGWVIIGRTPGGKAEYLFLTQAGQNQAAKIAGSCD